MGQLVALLPLISLQTGQVEHLQVGTLLVAVAEETDLELGGSPTSSQISPLVGQTFNGVSPNHRGRAGSQIPQCAQKAESWIYLVDQ